MVLTPSTPSEMDLKFGQDTKYNKMSLTWKTKIFSGSAINKSLHFEYFILYKSHDSPQLHSKYLIPCSNVFFTSQQNLTGINPAFIVSIENKSFLSDAISGYEVQAFCYLGHVVCI